MISGAVTLNHRDATEGGSCTRVRGPSHSAISAYPKVSRAQPPSNQTTSAGRSSLGWRLCIKSNELLGPRRPVAEFAATPRAYPPDFRRTTDATCRKNSAAITSICRTSKFPTSNPFKLWELACQRWRSLASVYCLTHRYREQASSHRFLWWTMKLRAQKRRCPSRDVAFRFTAAKTYSGSLYAIT